MTSALILPFVLMKAVLAGAPPKILTQLFHPASCFVQETSTGPIVTETKLPGLEHTGYHHDICPICRSVPELYSQGQAEETTTYTTQYTGPGPSGLEPTLFTITEPCPTTGLLRPSNYIPLGFAVTDLECTACPGSALAQVTIPVSKEALNSGHGSPLSSQLDDESSKQPTPEENSGEGASSHSDSPHANQGPITGPANEGLDVKGKSTHNNQQDESTVPEAQSESLQTGVDQSSSHPGQESSTHATDQQPDTLDENAPSSQGDINTVHSNNAQQGPSTQSGAEANQSPASPDNTLYDAGPEEKAQSQDQSQVSNLDPTKAGNNTITSNATNQNPQIFKGSASRTTNVQLLGKLVALVVIFLQV